MPVAEKQPAFSFGEGRRRRDIVLIADGQLANMAEILYKSIMLGG